MRVLYVEDEALNRRVMAAFLEPMGVVMREAADGQEGLDMIAQEDFDIILMDLRMPVMDGLTALQHLRAADGEKSSIPVVIVTADAYPAIREKCLAAGANAVVHKPIILKDLVRAIAHARTFAEAPSCRGTQLDVGARDVGRR